MDTLKYIAESLRPLAVRVDSLHLDPSNARKHGEKNHAAIKASLSRFGQRKPIVVQKSGRIVRAGNGTLEAARALGWDHIAVTIIDEEHTSATAYAIADNRTAELAEWDDDILSATLQSLGADGVDLEGLGYDAEDLASIIDDLGAGEGLTDADDVPEVPDEPRSKAGDVWRLGDHRLMCGDSTSAADVATLLDGEKPFMMVTDPPYGVNYDPTWRASSGMHYPNTHPKTGAVVNDARAEWGAAWDFFAGEVAYVWHGWRQVGVLMVGLGLVARFQIIWNKNLSPLSRGHYNPKHECCLYAVREGSTARWNGDNTQTSVWDIGSLVGGSHKEDKTNHGTQKPVECMARPIRNHGARGDAVYEPFSGSGTTIIACEQLGRRCYAMEVHPPYVDMAVERWENFTGQTAVLVRSTDAKA